MMVGPATAADLPGLLALEDGFPEPDRWGATAWAEEVDGAGRVTLVARDGDRIVGAVTLHTVVDTTDLNRIVVARDARRRGIADLLMRAGIESTSARILLEVEASNEPALGLYRKHGFAPIDIRRDYYGAGRDAIVLERPGTEGDPL